jgi:hypothetical protein
MVFCSTLILYGEFDVVFENSAAEFHLSGIVATSVNNRVGTKFIDDNFRTVGELGVEIRT